MGVVGFEQPTYTSEEDAGTVDVCVAFLHPAEIDPRVCVHLLGSTTDGTQGHRKDFLYGGAQSETTHRVVSNLYNNL